MPRAHRTFTLGPPPNDDTNVTFEVTGQYTTRPEDTWTETFTAVGLAPAGVLEDLTQTISTDPLTGRRRYSTMHCTGFLRAVLVPQDRERFDELMRDTDRLVGLVELVQVVAWLSDELTLRPSPPSSGSMPGGGTPDSAAMPVAAAG